MARDGQVILAQTPPLPQPSGSIDDIDDRAFPDIRALLSIVDSSGKPVLGLQSKDLTVSESGQRGTVESISPVVDKQVGIAIVLAIDVSGSMAGPSITQVKRAAHGFLDSLQPVDQVAIVSFSNTVTVIQPFTLNRVLAGSSIDRLQTGGNTALYGAVGNSIDLARGTLLSRKAVILLTDGQDFGGVSQVDRVASEASAAGGGVPVYTVGIGQDVDQAYLGGIAQSSGGSFFRAPAAEDIPGIYEQLSQRLRSQYVVTVRSAGPANLADRRLAFEIQTSAGTLQIEKQYRTSRPSTAEPSPIPSVAPTLAPSAVEATHEIPPATKADGASLLVPVMLAIIGIVVVVAVAFLMIRRRNEQRWQAQAAAQAARADRAVNTRTPGPTAQSSVNRASLRIIDGPQSGLNCEVGTAPVTIGSSPKCQLRLDPSSDVAPEHARIWWHDDKLMFHHLSKRGSSKVAGKEVSWTALDSGDVITIGTNNLQAVFDDSLEPAAR